MSDRKDHWEKIYTDKSPQEVSWHQSQPDLSLNLIHDACPELDAPIIDVGGGSSTLVDYLIKEGYSNIGVLDIAEKALAYSRNRLGKQAAQVVWYTSDITSFIPSRQFSVWHDRAVFHFLTEETDRKKYVEVLNKSLMPGGHLIIAAFAIGGPTKCSGLDIVQYDVQKLKNELGPGFVLIDERHETHVTPADKKQKFNYFHFIKQS